MRKIITLFLVIPGFVINAQVIDINHFDEGKMSEVMFSRMNNSIEQKSFYNLYKTSVGHRKIYRFIKKRNEIMPVNDLNAEIIHKILREFESKVMTETNIVGNISLITSIQIDGFITYQAVADSCITTWTNSENLIFLNWSQIGEAVSYFNKRTRIVYVFFAYLQ